MTAPLYGFHAVKAALDAGRPIERVLVVKGAQTPRIRELVEACRTSRVPVRFENREQLDRLVKGGVHQGVVAFAAQQRYADLEDVLAENDPQALLVVDDGVEDPRNLGAIIRSAEAAGAQAVLVPERRSAGLTETVAKAAAGALERLPVVRVKNVNRLLDDLKSKSFWIHGLDERGDRPHFEADLQGRVALVLGAEGKGLHRLTAEKCDFLLRIPMRGDTPSLNVSVAAGIVLFEAVRQRHLAGV